MKRLAQFLVFALGMFAVAQHPSLTPVFFGYRPASWIGFVAGGGFGPGNEDDDPDGDGWGGGGDQPRPTPDPLPVGSSGFDRELQELLERERAGV
jgi:hypothetical protein